MKPYSKSSLSTALVIKRVSVGEADRIITLLTQESGKIAVVAKGVRKIKSSKRAFLEPGNLAKIFLIKTKGLPILTQARLVEDTSPIRDSLAKMRQLSQLLEIVDKLFVEEEVEDHVFELVMRVRKKILIGSGVGLKKDLAQLIEWLGFPSLAESGHESILDYVSEITGQKMRSFEFLKVK
jgi:recombinational DNA repair protein (RecF pathway)